MIGTRILKIASEIVEITEVKVGTCQRHRGIKIISMLKVETLTSSISAISKLIFKILVAIM